MHKKVPPDKRGRQPRAASAAVPRPGSRHNAGTAKQGRGRPDSVKDLLSRANPVLAGLARRIEQQQDISGWAREQLPAELAAHVTEVLEKEGELWLFAESAAWAGRLRFAVQELHDRLMGTRPGTKIKSVRVKVMPRGTRE